jgi:Carboxymuconolactone decarboxylase family
VADDLAALMPPGAPPIALFRVLAHNPRILSRFRAGHLLDAGALSARECGLTILRVCHRCDCDYEWSVHVAGFADAAGLAEADLHVTLQPTAEAPLSCRERLMLARPTNWWTRAADPGNDGCVASQPCSCGDRRTDRAGRPVHVGVNDRQYSGAAARTGSPAMDGIDKLNLPPCAPRIAPLEPPYAADIAAALFRIHPSDLSREPLKLLRTMVRSLRLCDPMFAFARFTLGRNTATAASYDRQTRELVIDRVTARCGGEYE